MTDAVYTEFCFVSEFFIQKNFCITFLCNIGLVEQLCSFIAFLFLLFLLFTDQCARLLLTLCFSFFLFPAGHSVSYLEYMTHMAADHWQKRRREQFLYEWYLKITKFEHDLRLECNQERSGGWGGGFTVGTFGLGSLTELYCGGNDDPW